MANHSPSTYPDFSLDEQTIGQLVDVVTEKLAKHTPPFVVAVDGLSASGKGTVSRRLAELLGCAYLETGLLYRVTAWDVLRHNGDPEDPIASLQAAQRLATNPSVMDQIPIDVLRQEAVGQASSKVSVFPEVRQVLLQLQRDFAVEPPNIGTDINSAPAKGAVLDGRDIGTVVWPQANVKIFVTATPEIRAERRYKEYLERVEKHDSKNPTDISPEEEQTYQKILTALIARDDRDIHRIHAPVKPAADSVLLDTSELSKDACLIQVLEAVLEKL